MKRNTLLAGAGALTLILAGGAYAAGDMGKDMHHHGPMGMMHGDPSAMADHLMSHFDLNKDGKITKDEIMRAGQQEADEHFKAMDANHDGNVTADELYQAHAAHMREHIDEMFKQMDKNGDGKLTQDEFAAAAPRMMMHHHGWMHGHEGMDGDEN